jgi:hypothetical protein
VSPTIKDFLGFVVNPPPGDPATTAMSDQVPKSVVTTAAAGSGTIPAADGVGGYTWIASTGPGPAGPQGPTGAQGPPGQGVPAGGLAGYVLAKSSAVDYSTVWQPPGGGPAGPPGQGVPAGGATGQALVKSSSADYATTWVTPAAAGPAGGDLTGAYPNPKLSIATVTSLPGSPVDGQEVYLIADDANGVIWHLRYRAASASSHKWEFVGGPPLTHHVTTNESTASTTYADLATVQNIIAPVAGDYDVTFGAQAYTGTAGYTYVGLFAAAALQVESAILPFAATSPVPHALTWRTLNVGAAVDVRLRFHATSGTAYFQTRFLSLAPVRLG